jgi:hypothetical protein
VNLAMQEYTTGKRFDNDGILNRQENQERLSALRNGFQKKLYRASNRTDPKLGLKVVQKKGKAHISNTGDQKIPSQPVIEKVKPAYNVRNNLLQIFN